MKNGKKWLGISLWANAALLAGWLALMYAYISNVSRYDGNYTNFTSSEIGISAQKLLLKTLIEGRDRASVIEMVKNEAAKPENSGMKLEVGGDAIALGEIRIVLEGGKAADVK